MIIWAGKLQIMKKIRFLFLFSFLLCAGYLHAQYTSDYDPVKYSSSGYKMSEATFNKKLKIPYNTSDPAMIKKFNQYLYILYRSYATESKEKQFIEEAFIKNYLETILDIVTAKNGLKEEFEIVCTRYAVPNAFNMGDNKLYVNIGLLEQLENEAQIAFMLCHELSHQLLFHVQDAFIAEEKRAKDKAVKKQIRDINKAKYNKLDKTFQFVKNYNYDFAKYSRANERSADSMAVVLLQKTDYDLREGKGLMEILDHIDEDSTKIDYHTYFDKDSVSIKNEWIVGKKPALTFSKKKAIEFDKDSIKTHPNIPNRINMIDSQLLLIGYSHSGKKLFVQPKATFDSIVSVSKFEIIEAYQKRKRYAAVVYYGIRLLSAYPENKYLYKNISIALNELSKAVKKHTVQNYIPIESDEDFSEGYNQLLRIIDRTTAEEFDALVKNFITQYYSKISSYPEIQTIYNELSKK